MKSKPSKDESIFKKKGFYYTLYGSLGIVMVLGAVVSFNNLNKVDEPSKRVELSQLEATNNSTTKSYLAPDDREVGYELELSEKRITNQNQTTPKTTEAPKITPEKTNPATETPSSKETPSKAVPAKEQPAKTTTPNPANSTKEAPNKEAAPKSTPGATSPTSKEETPNNEAKPDAADEKKKPTAEAEFEEEQPIFTAFDTSEKMEWPVVGEIVMEFSDNHAIYDITLDQYRTNDTICIAASMGTQVKAAAEGVIREVTKTREHGNTVVIDNGNGFTTTYGQLQDGVLVKEGDVVEKGQVIGGVGSPSIYSVLLGNHLSFKVAQEDEVLNPLTLLDTY